MTLSRCCRSHTIHRLSDLISFDTCSSGPVLSGNGSVMTTGVREDGNQESDTKLQNVKLGYRISSAQCHSVLRMQMPKGRNEKNVRT